MPQFMLFATKADYDQLAASDELFSNLYFVPDISYPENAYTVVKGLSSLPDLGFITAKQYFGGPRYWVFPEPPKLRLRATPPIDGKRWYDLYGGSFKVALQFTPNGVYRKKTLVGGSLEATSKVGDTIRIYKQISKAVERVFARSKYYGDVAFAGPDAIERQKKGLRLADSTNPAPELDFNLQEDPLAKFHRTNRRT